MNQDFHSIEHFLDDISVLVDDVISQTMTEVKPQDLDLDPRSATYLFVSEDTIAVHDSFRDRLNYYGGFEYVDSQYVQTVGGYTFYSAEDYRVREHLDAYCENKLNICSAE